MVPKRVTAAFWDNDLTTAHVLNVSSKGLCKDQMEKLGSDASAFGANIVPEKGYAFLHVITNGAGEYYGQNQNLDYFNEKEAAWTFPKPKKGIEKTARLKGGLKEYHKTYRQYGGVYRNHKNSRKIDPDTGKPFEKQGEIVDERYNEPMHRGEVIVKLPEARWGDVIEKVANGQPVCWSMGSSVPSETCSVCGNVAKTLKQRCPCLRADFHKIAEDGHVAFAINDETYYHDISEVGTNPAMKIAYTMEKVAATGMTPRKPEFTNLGLWLPMDVVKQMTTATEYKRYDLLQKLAKAEREAGEEVEELSDAFEEDDGQCMHIANMLKGLPLDEIFSATHKKNMLLSPKTFTVILIRNSKPGASDDEVERIASGVPSKLGNIFSQLLGNPDDVDEVCSDGHYCPHCSFPSIRTMSRLTDLSDELSVEPSAVRKRIIIKIVKGEPKKKMEKKACMPGSVEDRMATVLAKEYAKYQIAFLANTQGPYDFSSAVLAQNK